MIIKLRHFLFLGLMLLLSGCKLAILNPKGMIAASEERVLVAAVLLMLIVVIPAIILSFVFAWRYRKGNTKAKYMPNWSYSAKIEAVCWIVPCIIISVLATMTWISTHKLDPYRPLDIKKKPIIIQAIALNWKWLFIYPEQHIATINFVQIPAHVPIRFYVTSDAPMNSFEIPQLAGQIYAMTGMRTKLNLIADEKGTYAGLSTNFSGDGFSGMRFVVKAYSKARFDEWVSMVQRSPKQLTMSQYNKLVKPSEHNKVQYFSSPMKNLFNKVILKYMGPGMHLSKD